MEANIDPTLPPEKKDDAQAKEISELRKRLEVIEVTDAVRKAIDAIEVRVRDVESLLRTVKYLASSATVAAVLVTGLIAYEAKEINNTFDEIKITQAAVTTIRDNVLEIEKRVKGETAAAEKTISDLQASAKVVREAIAKNRVDIDQAVIGLTDVKLSLSTLEGAAHDLKAQFDTPLVKQITDRLSKVEAFNKDIDQRTGGLAADVGRQKSTLSTMYITLGFNGGCPVGYSVLASIVWGVDKVNYEDPLYKQKLFFSLPGISVDDKTYYIASKYPPVSSGLCRKDGPL